MNRIDKIWSDFLESGKDYKIIDCLESDTNILDQCKVTVNKNKNFCISIHQPSYDSEIYLDMRQVKELKDLLCDLLEVE